MKPESKPIHLIGYAKCTGVERRSYSSFAYDDGFAERDGFVNSRELREWFGDPFIYGGEEYDVISFKLHFSDPDGVARYIKMIDSGEMRVS